MKWTEKNEKLLMELAKNKGSYVGGWESVSNFFLIDYKIKISANACRHKYNQIKSRQAVVKTDNSETVILNNVDFPQEVNDQYNALLKANKIASGKELLDTSEVMKEINLIKDRLLKLETIVNLVNSRTISLQPIGPRKRLY
jgi:hypothetical protein